jgi:hypothetical protein
MAKKFTKVSDTIVEEEVSVKEVRKIDTSDFPQLKARLLKQKQVLQAEMDGVDEQLARIEEIEQELK